MKVTPKKIFIIIGIIVGLFGVEILREWVWYTYKLKSYQASYWEINNKQLNKKDVKAIVGDPDSIETTDAEYWHYNSERYQGYIWRKLKLRRQDEFYQLVVQFDKDGMVSDVYSFGH
jgi:outer membrane protein assembly factor BamE (lipoprotein component of BamABCDE complex)